MGPAPPLSLLIKYCIILNVLYPALLLFHTEVSQKSLKSLFCGHFKSDLKNKEGSGLLCATQELRCCLILAFKKLNIITVNLARSVFKTLCFSKVRQKQSEGVRSDGQTRTRTCCLVRFVCFFVFFLLDLSVLITAFTLQLCTNTEEMSRADSNVNQLLLLTLPADSEWLSWMLWLVNVNIFLFPADPQIQRFSTPICHKWLETLFRPTVSDSRTDWCVSDDEN